MFLSDGRTEVRARLDLMSKVNVARGADAGSGRYLY